MTRRTRFAITTGINTFVFARTRNAFAITNNLTARAFGWYHTFLASHRTAYICGHRIFTCAATNRFLFFFCCVPFVTCFKFASFVSGATTTPICCAVACKMVICFAFIEKFMLHTRSLRQPSTRFCLFTAIIIFYVFIPTGSFAITFIVFTNCPTGRHCGIGGQNGTNYNHKYFTQRIHFIPPVGIVFIAEKNGGFLRNKYHLTRWRISGYNFRIKVPQKNHRFFRHFFFCAAPHPPRHCTDFYGIFLFVPAGTYLPLPHPLRGHPFASEGELRPRRE